MGVLLQKYREEIARLEKEREEENISITKYGNMLTSNTPSTFTDLVLCYLDEHPAWYDTDTKIFWKWDNEKLIWRMSNEIEIERDMIHKYSIFEIIKPQYKSMIRHTLMICANKQPEEPPATWIQFNDKIVDYITDQIYDPNPKYFMRNVIPYSIGETEETPVLDMLLKDWLGEDKIMLGYELMAYLMVRDYPIQRIFVFLGEGSNGKGSFLNLLLKWIGEDNATSVEIERLTNNGDRFHSSKLKDKLFAFAGESTYSMFKKTGLIKSLCGGDYIHGEFKGKTGFSFKNYAKIFFATNGLPLTMDRTEGFYRRFYVIDFPNKFTGGSDVVKYITDVELECFAKKSIRILKELLERKKFIYETDIAEKMKIYEAKSNPIGVFIKECFIEDDDAYTSTMEFQHKYKEWAEKNKSIYRVLRPTEMNHAMREMGYYVVKKRIDDGLNPVHVWNGIMFKSIPKSSNDDGGNDKLSSFVPNVPMFQ